MNTQRGLLRIWMIASVIWIIYLAWDFWQSCRLIPGTGRGALWCDTGQDDWLTELKNIGLMDYGRGAVMALTPPIISLILGFAIAWTIKGFRKD